MADLYRLKSPIVTAEQFHEAERPWPDGVDACPAGAYPGLPHLHSTRVVARVPVTVTVPVQDGDWIVTDETGVPAVVPAAEFRARYEPAAPWRVEDR